MIPPDIVSYLTPDEEIKKVGKCSEGEIYVTDKRIIFKKGGVFSKEILDASYRHISSIEYKKETPLGLIIVGIVAIIIAYFLYDKLPRLFEYSMFFLDVLFNTVLPLLLGLMGIVFIIASKFTSPSYMIHIVGRTPIKLSGKNLEGIIMIIRQYREQVKLEDS